MPVKLRHATVNNKKCRDQRLFAGTMNTNKEEKVKKWLFANPMYPEHPDEIALEGSEKDKMLEKQHAVTERQRPRLELAGKTCNSLFCQKYTSFLSRI